MEINLIPKLKKCPSCESFNMFKVNGITYDDNFQSLTDWTLKKKINCRKCKVELGWFTYNTDKKQEKLVWLDYLKCDEHYLTTLCKLEKKKNKYQELDKKKEYLKILKEIETIQNQIRIDKVKVKIKVKIQNKGMII